MIHTIIKTSSGKVVFVISGGGGDCPRLLIEEKKAVLKDDYKGVLRMRRNLVGRMPHL